MVLGEWYAQNLPNRVLFPPNCQNITTKVEEVATLDSAGLFPWTFLVHFARGSEGFRKTQK
jgi:hypothetical protein